MREILVNWPPFYFAGRQSDYEELLRVPQINEIVRQYFYHEQELLDEMIRSE